MSSPATSMQAPATHPDPTAPLLDQIPSVDLRDFLSGDPERRRRFVADLGAAYEQIGFVALRGHGLSDDLQSKLYRAVEAFFRLPQEEKLNCYDDALAGQRGYTPPGRERAKGFAAADLKEFYQIGQELPEGDPDKGQPDYPDNLWPESPADFREHALAAYQILEQTGRTLLQAIALHLGLDVHFFDDKVYHGNSIVRCIHYPPLDPDKVPEGAVRAGAHGDINLITLLMGASAEGLEVLRRDGVWIPITALPDQLVVNVGDMLDRLTNHKLKSTIHQVVNPPRERMGTPRYSIPFFMHPRSEVDLTCLDSCVDANHPKLYNDMTAGEFLDERLREIGLKK